MEIKFDNISKFCTRQLERDNVQIMMAMRRPVKVLLKTKEGFKEVPSPLRFSAEDKMFMNSWNFKQVLFMEGTLEITMRLDQLIKLVHSSDLVPKVSPENLGNIRVLSESEPKCIELQDRMADYNIEFNSLLKTLVLPIRFSILALLSSRKCSVFDDTLIRLMKYILDLQFEDELIYKMA